MSIERNKLVQLYGKDPIAYSTLQKGLSYFDTSFGFIAYKRVGHIDITLGPPICADNDLADLLDRFIRFSKKPIFSYVTENVIQQIKDSDLYCGGMGIDRFVDHKSLRESPDKQVRSACKKARKSNFIVEPINLNQLTRTEKERFDTITQHYLTNAQCSTELCFLNRPVDFQADGMKRCFKLSKTDKEHNGTFGYAVMNPFYNQGEITGYLLDIIRFEKTRLWGVWLSTVSQLSQLMAQEGKIMSLGFCSFFDIQSPPACSSKWMDFQVNLMARLLGLCQYVRRLQELKTIIPGHKEPRYFASYSPLALVTLVTLLRACGINMSALFGIELLQTIRAGLFNKS